MGLRTRPFALLSVLFCMAGFSVPAAETGFVVRTDSGSVNWETGEVLVTGSARVRPVVKDLSDPSYDAADPFQPRNVPSARLMARREAEDQVRLNAEVLFRSLRVNDEKTLADFMARPGVNGKVNSFLSERGTLVSSVLSENVHTVVYSYKLFGPNGLLSLNDEDDPDDDFIVFRTEAWPAYQPQTNKSSWDGIVISAPYLKLSPALAPRIYSENGNLIYDASFIESDPASENGMAVYATTPFHLLKGPAERYYHCLAVNTTTFRGTDLVISDEDAARICSSPSTLKNLRKCRVIILAAEPVRKNR